MPAEDRSVLSSLRGLPAWTAVLLAAAISLTGVAIDSLSGELGAAFTVAFFVGDEARACLAIEDVRLEAPLAHRAPSPRGSGVEDRAGVGRAVRDESHDLQHVTRSTGEACHRAADDDRSVQRAVVVHHAEREAVPL